MARSEVVSVNLPDRVRTEIKHSVSAQAGFLRDNLASLHLDNFTVSEVVQFRSAKEFDTRLTIGITGMEDIPVAMVAAGSESSGSEPIQPMLIFPTSRGTSILKDRTSSALYTNGFWICEDSRFQYIVPDKPVQLDGLLTMFDPDLDVQGAEHIIDSNGRIDRITENKQLTKEILARAGIPVPPGIFVTHNEQETINNRLQALTDIFDLSDGFVVKGNTGSQGSNVKLFEEGQLTEAEAFANELFAQGLDVIVEKRIIPKDFPLERRAHRATFSGQADHNSRTLVTLSKENPVVFDAEERFGEKNGDPINISRGAFAARLDEVYDLPTINAIFDTSIKAAKVICNESVADPHQPMLGMLGLDIITDIHGVTYVIEANAGAVGGISTLTKLDKKPLSSISHVFFPASREFLMANHAHRKSPDPHQLVESPLTPMDRLQLISAFLADKDLFRVKEQVAKLPIDQYPGNEEYFSYIALKLHQAGYPKDAQRVLDKIAEQSPHDISIQRARAVIEISEGRKRFNDVLGNQKMEFYEDKMFVSELISGLLIAGREEQALEIMADRIIEQDPPNAANIEVVTLEELASRYFILALQEKNKKRKKFYEKKAQEARARFMGKLKEHIVFLEASIEEQRRALNALGNSPGQAENEIK